VGPPRRISLPRGGKKKGEIGDKFSRKREGKKGPAADLGRGALRPERSLPALA